MDSFLGFIIRQKKFALVFTLFVLVTGLLTLQEIRRDQFPAVDFEVMSITTVFPGASPADVEKSVTELIEGELKNLNGIDKYTSSSREGVSSVIVTLSQNINDIQTVKTDIRNAVSGISNLPEEVTTQPRVVDWNTTQFPVLQINIDGSNIDYNQARQITDELQKHLASIKGIAKVEKEGYLDSEVQIRLDPLKLQQYQLSIDQVRLALSGRNARYTVGDNNLNPNKNIVLLSEYQGLNDIEDTVIKSSYSGPIIRLKDIAKIVRDNATESQIVRVNGTKGFLLRAVKQEQADVIRTVDLIKKKVTEMQETYPQELRIFFTNDQSSFVRNRLEIVTNNGLFGLALVLIVLGIFLSLKTAFWVAVSLPVCLLGTIAILGFMGETINVISLAAMILVLGIVVDDSIVIAESIHHHKMRGGNVYDNVVVGFKRVIMPVVTTILTSILAMSSMFLMTGTMGKFIYLIPVVVIIALTLSFLEVSLALPAHLAGSKFEKQKTWFIPIENWFETNMVKMLAKHYWIVVFFSALFAFSLYFAIVHMPFTLFPAKGSDSIQGFVKAPTGSTSAYTEEVVIEIEKIIIEEAGEDLKSYTSNIGSYFTNQARLELSLTPSNGRSRSAQSIVEAIQERTNLIQGVEEINLNIDRPGPPSGQDVEIILVSSDNNQRAEAVDYLEMLLKNTAGVDSIERDDNLGKPRIEVVLDFDSMSQLSINYQQVYKHLRAVYSGIDVTDVSLEESDVEVRIYVGDDNFTEDFIAQTQVLNQQGKLISMSQFSTIRELEGEPDYNHFNGDRSVTISASVDDSLNTSQGVMKTVLKSFDVSDRFPQVRVISEGGGQEAIESMTSFRNAFIMSIFGVFLLLAILFNSYSQPMLVIASIPFSFVGVIWAFYFHGEVLSFFAVMGCLALIGVIVNDSLVLVSHLNYVKLNKNDSEERREWIARGSRDRLRPVLLTSLTTLAGVLPLAYGLGGIDFLLQPMVLALGYGLLFGTVMTLILLPCMYLMNYDFINWLSKVKQNRQNKSKFSL